jgi:hypothetical protein
MTVLLEPYLARAWLELPVLLEEFVEQAAPAMRLPRQRLREAIGERLGISEFDEIWAICRAIATTVSLLKPALQDMDFDVGARDPERTGIAAACVQAWVEAGEELGAIAALDMEAIEPIEELPWRRWSAWERGGESVPTSRLPADAQESALHTVLSEDAWALLERFMGACAEWRGTVLDAFAPVYPGTPLGLLAIDEAADLAAALGTSGDPNHAVRDLLFARGFTHADVDVLAECQKQRDADQKPELRAYSERTFKEVLARADSREGPLAVRYLRRALQWMPPGLLDGAYESGPCMWQALAFLPANCFLEVSVGVYGSTEFAPFSTVYVEREEDIPFVMRCVPGGPERASIVSKEEAQHMDSPHLAGYIAVIMWD